MDGRFDWRDGGRRGAADGGYGVGGGGQPGRGASDRNVRHPLQQVSGIAVNIPGMCFKLLLAVISTVFMELDFPQIMHFLEKIIPEKWKETVSAVKKGTFGTMGKCVAAYVFIFLMTFAELAAGLLLLQIEGAFAIAFLIAVLDILPVLGHGNRAASVGGDCVCRRQCQNGNRGHGAVSDHHGGAQHCGTEAGGKTDGALAGCDAAVHDSRASLFRNPWSFGVPLLARF